MTRREIVIVQMALTYLLANREDAIDAFEVDYPAWLTGWDSPTPEKVLITVGTVQIEPPTEEEIQNLLKQLE
jgi:hypothetical protein